MKDIEDLLLNAHVDVASRISLAMQRRGLTATKVADLAGITKGRMSQLLSGEENLRVSTIVKVLAAIDCRFDLLVTKSSLDEWEIKHRVADLEKEFWLKDQEIISTNTEGAGLLVTGVEDPQSVVCPDDKVIYDVKGAFKKYKATADQHADESTYQMPFLVKALA